MMKEEQILEPMQEEETRQEEQTGGDPAPELSEAEVSAQEQEHYVERPRSQRILAWTLLGVTVLGVILYYLWLSGVLK